MTEQHETTTHTTEHTEQHEEEVFDPAAADVEETDDDDEARGPGGDRSGQHEAGRPAPVDQDHDDADDAAEHDADK